MLFVFDWHKPAPGAVVGARASGRARFRRVDAGDDRA